MMRKLWYLLVALFLVACGGTQNTGTTTGEALTGDLMVFAAASLNDAFNEIGSEFTAQNPGATVTFNFGGSSQLATQLLEGAQADVFASANERQMQVVVEGGEIAPDAPQRFASNRLAVIVPANNPAGITALEDLDQPGILLVLALPGVPARQYTDDIVANLGPDFSGAFYANLVSEEENVRRVVTKIALGEADAGLVYTSDVTPDVANRVRQISIPDEQNVVALYPIAPLANAPQPELAEAFIQFVLSDAGQEILARWGFGPR